MSKYKLAWGFLFVLSILAVIAINIVVYLYHHPQP